MTDNVSDDDPIHDDSDDTRPLPDAGRQAEGFERIRQAHQLEVAEDYVEMIADLIDANGEARLVELAGRFGVSHVTANKVVNRLQREGLVHTKPYRAIFLTGKGRDLAERARHRHKLVADFLRAIGVDNKTAEMDAEGIEHHVSETTLARFEHMLARWRGE